MKKILFILALIPILSFCQIEKIITVIGTAELETEPDWIIIGMTARETENVKKESEIVQMENSILDFIVSLGIDPIDFSVDRYSGNTIYNYSSNSKFKLTKWYSLKISNIALLDTVIAKCFDAGMDNISVTQLGHSQIDSLKSVVLINALKSAQVKAGTIAESMKLTLGKVLSVDENYLLTNNQAGSYYYDDLRLESLGVIGYGGQSRARVGSSIALQKIKISKSVIVKYEIQ